ncbi:MAG: hypothetical protein ABL888_21915 [Pirellulaceae bacterium]
METRLKKQRINVALMERDHFAKLMDAGVSTLDVAMESQKRLLEAQLDFHTDPREIVAVWQQALESAKNVEVVVRRMHHGGSDVTVQQVGQATFNRLDFELKLLQAKRKHGLPEHSKEESTK